MAQKKDAYDDGENLTPEGLMQLALNKYEVLNKQDVWNAKSPEEEKIVALNAELQKIKDTNLKLASAIKKAAGGKGNQQSGNPGGNNNQGQGRRRGKKGKGKTVPNDHAWKKVPPKDGEASKKQHSGRTYNWCKYHQAWVLHDPEGKDQNGCRKRQQIEKDQQTGSNKKDNSPLANALSAILTDIQEEE